MNETIERVARAIHDAGCCCGTWREPSMAWKEQGLTCPYNEVGPYHSPEHLEDWVEDARVAIAAMREPTQAMVFVGWNQIAEPCSLENIADAWRAMNDKALSEGGCDD